MVKAKCPVCGKVTQFEDFVEKPCSCGEAIGHLTVDWEIIEAEEKEDG